MTKMIENTMTAAEHRQKAAELSQEAQDSFDRSDTDGFLSQFASTVMSSKELLQASIVENGGKWEFQALFDLEGNLIPAKTFANQYRDTTWGILATEDPQSSFVSYVSQSKARDNDKFVKNMAKKGYYVGTVEVPAYADLGGGGKGMGGMCSVHAVVRRTDGGFSADSVIVDNGQDKLKEMGLI